MGSGKGMEQLYQLACDHMFEDFDALFADLEAVLPPDLFWEAHLMRAQIKLFASDASMMDDLQIAGQAHKPPTFACLNAVWEADALNRFIVFSGEPGVLKRFYRTLPQARQMMAAWYGGQGEGMVCQVQSGLEYFIGDIEAALALSEEPYHTAYENHTDAMLTLCLQHRCYLALGKAQEAEQTIMEAIRLSKNHPECVAPYVSFRGWANITTSWNGDSPRFVEDADGTKQPVLDDRLEGVQRGYARTTQLEAPFIDYAERHDQEAYALRQHYMDIFNAIYWLSVGNEAQTNVNCRKLCDMVSATGIIMPLVECGEQGMPLLRYIRDNGFDGSGAWLNTVSAMAMRYEKTLEKYRAINA